MRFTTTPRKKGIACAALLLIQFGALQRSFAQTATDGCGYNVGNQYTVSSSCVPQAFNKPGIFGADMNPTGCNGSNFDDAFGWFTATSTTTYLIYDPSGTERPIMHVFTGACGSLSQIDCNDPGTFGGNASLTLTTTIGTNYMVRIQRNGTSNSMNGTICIWSPTPPANDEPCNAAPLTVGSTCGTTSGTTVIATTTSGIPAPGCGNFTGADVWYSIVAPANGIVSIETSSGSLTNTDIALYSATACNGTFTLIECDDLDGPGNNGGIYRTGLTPGQTYYVRVWGNGTATGTFSICAVSLVNDDPCAAVSLTVGTTCSSIASTTLYATATNGIPAPGCGSYTGGDVWFTVVAPANGILSIETSSGSLTNTDIALYSATACNGTFTLIECDDLDGPGNNGGIYRTGLTPGQTYYVRAWGNGTATGTFSICAVSLPNDDPCAAVSLTVGPSCTNTAGTNGYATATSGIPAPGCAGYTGGDVWFSFVAPAGGGAQVTTSAGSLTDSGIALYSATACNGTYTLIACDDNTGPGSMSQITHTTLTPGQTYYVRVWGNGGASGSFNICVVDNSPPVNDDPCNAIALTLNSTCGFTAYANVNATATAGIPAPGCGTYSGGDVWFSFVAPSNGLVTLRTAAGTMTNADMAVYSATACNGTFTLVHCDASSGAGNMPFGTLTPLELVAGQTYYVRVWGNNGTSGTFNFCAITPATTGTCVYVLRMYDSQGDGWGASNVSVQVGAGSPVSYSLTNADQEVVYIAVNTGDIVQLSYNTGGSGSQGEISYVLQLMYGSLYSDGPTPGTGLRYAAVATCQSPAPSQSDCYGNQSICNSQQISATPNSTGLTADLNVNTRGCLGSNERQGLWYSFSPSAAGNLGFTIAPSNALNDYDFAVWGPYASLSCPPAGPPIRCNYSGASGNTGLSTTGTNPSEGAGGPRWSTTMNVNAGEYYFLYISNWSQSGLAFNLSWQLAAGASLDCTMLPLEFLGLDGRAVTEGVHLEWATATESHTSAFLVERLAADGNFEQIGELPAAGFSSTRTNYSFVDAHPVIGMNTYRVKMTEVNGTVNVSNVIAVMYRFDEAHGVLYPNPATDQVNMVLELAEDAVIAYTVIDASGRIARTGQQSLTAGGARLSVPVSDLDAGYYEMSIVLPNGRPMHAGRFMVH